MDLNGQADLGAQADQIVERQQLDLPSNDLGYSWLRDA
jgi:hypothetical protein